MMQGKFVFLSNDEMRLLSLAIDSWVRDVRQEIREKGIGGLAHDMAEGGAQQLERLKNEFDKLSKGPGKGGES